MKIVEFQVGNEHYAVDIQDVNEIVSVAPSDILILDRTSDGPNIVQGIISLRGKSIPVVKGSSLLGKEDSSIEFTELSLIILGEDDEMFALTTDKVIGIHEASEEDIMRATVVISSLVDSIIRKDEHLLALLDIDSIIIEIKKRGDLIL